MDNPTFNPDSEAPLVGLALCLLEVAPWKKFLVSLMALGFVCSAHASEEPSLQDMILVSKMAGACGVMQQMASFQTATKLPGGSEFIESFWRTEFARLGKTQETFFKECDGSIAAYNQLWQASEQLKK